MARPAHFLPALGLLLGLSAVPGQGGELRDLYYGEVLFKARQGEYFDALERLDTELNQHRALDEPRLDSLYYYRDDAEFAVGDLELRYRMHHRAGRAITAVLEGDVEEPVRNEAAYRLARIHFQKGQLDEALNALDRMQGEIPAAIRDDAQFLRANTYLAAGEPGKAIPLLERLEGARGLEGFVAYNLGIALLQDGRQEQAITRLDRAGRLPASDEPALAIRDKANLVAGTIRLESGDLDGAARLLERIRVEGPFANQALLSSGWADMSAGRAERATVPWSMLASRELTDAATQEAMLALPYAYGKLDLHGRAAEYYGRALDAYGAEIAKLDASIQSIRQGKFREALVREEIRQDKDWVIRLRALPETPETYYLMELMASHDFQTGLQNYLDMEDLRKRLKSWQRSLDAFEDMIEIRRVHYEPLLPEVDGEFRQLDSRMRLRLQQHKLLERKLQGMLTAPRPEFLATREEQAMLARIESIESVLREQGLAEDGAEWQRVQRLRGRLSWILVTEYEQRLDDFHQHLAELRQSIQTLEQRYEQFVRVRQAASHSYQGYERQLLRQRQQVRDSLDRIGRLMARQGRLLERVAIDELGARRARLEKYRDDARYALADSYDRATQAQARRAGP